jgi:exodeoxyribonuclease VII large subunit
MALVTSADSPAPLRQVSTLVGEYVGRLGAVWVEAEIATVTRRQGVCFLTLRDLRAQVSMAATCHVSILDAGPAPVTEGARVVVHAKPAFYPPSGRLQLEIREIRPQGEGELLARLERRKQLLAAEGLFDPRLKKRLPFLPRAVGLVTARGSAAERDVLENARARWPAVNIVVRHAVMQGADSASEVMNAVRALEVSGDVDVIVISRGGGSIEDLLPFSDEGLIRAVYACSLPVVSAIGHEQDTPLLDLVADVRASTPTGAAELIVPDVREELAGMTAMRGRALQAVHTLLAHETHVLAQLRSRPVLANPVTVVDAQQKVIVEARNQARRELHHRLSRAQDQVGSHLARVRSLSPLATLERGYAVAQRPDGSVITALDQVPEEFGVRLSDGSVDVRTVSTKEIPHG